MQLLISGDAAAHLSEWHWHVLYLLAAYVLYHGAQQAYKLSVNQDQQPSLQVHKPLPAQAKPRLYSLNIAVRCSRSRFLCKH